MGKMGFPKGGSGSVKPDIKGPFFTFQQVVCPKAVVVGQMATGVNSPFQSLELIAVVFQDGLMPLLQLVTPRLKPIYCSE